MNRPQSNSSGNLFEACPFAYYQKYDLGIPELENSAARKGKACHELIYKYGNYCLQNNAQSSYSIAKKLMQEYLDQWNPEPGRTIESPLSIEEIADVTEIFNRYIDSHMFESFMKERQFEHKLAVDANWNICDFNSSECYFRGVVDFHYRQGFDKIVFVDYKSNLYVPPKINIEENSQFRYYAFLLSLKYPSIRTFEGTYDFIRYGATQTYTFDSESIRSVPEEICGLHNNIRKETKWNPRVSDLCNFCSYRLRCPSMKKAHANMLVEQPINNAQEAVAAAKQVFQAEIVIKNMKSKLKTYVKDIDGMIPVNENESFGYHYKKKRSVDVQKVIPALLKFGYSEDEIQEKLTLAPDKLDKLLKSDKNKLEERHNDLEDQKILISKDTTEFGCKKLEKK